MWLHNNGENLSYFVHDQKKNIKMSTSCTTQKKDDTLIHSHLPSSTVNLKFVYNVHIPFYSDMLSLHYSKEMCCLNGLGITKAFAFHLHFTFVFTMSQLLWHWGWTYYSKLANETVCCANADTVFLSLVGAAQWQPAVMDAFTVERQR